MSTQHAAAITARLDRLPGCRHIWKLVLLLSFGGFFEHFELFQTAYVSPGLIRSGIFSATNQGLFGLSDQATFAAATFLGLFLGTFVLGSVADRFGRRTIFTIAFLWYTVSTIVMAFRNTAIGIDLWRLIGGVGLGVGYVTIDTYIAELVPKRLRGRAFAFNSFVQFLAVPIVAFLAYRLIPNDPYGIPGWRWIMFLGSAGAVVVWFLRAGLPESPRWLALHGRSEEAERVIEAIEGKAIRQTGAPLPPVSASVTEEEGTGSLAEIWRPPYRRRTVMLMVFNFFQTIGFYGFGNWVPALLASRGASVVHSLQYSSIISIAYPAGSLLFLGIADRFERKSQIVAGALGTALFGVLFATQTGAVPLIVIGVLITFSNSVMSYAYHAYQPELYPTRVRARAVGFCYSWSRLSTIFTSFMTAFFLQNFGTAGVFVFIGASMLVVVIAIGVFGPRTRGLALEEISH